MEIIKMPMLKPKKFLKIEMKVRKKGKSVKKLVDQAISYYFLKFVNEGITDIPEEFLDSFELNVYLETINISYNMYKKVYEHVKNVPYGVSDIISYALFLYYEKILQE